MGLGLRETGGRLVTIEYDPVRAKELAENIRRAGSADVVQVVAGDAFVQIPKIHGTFDFVFLDAWKKDYKRFFDLIYPRLDTGGLFIAHNVVNKKSEMGDFLDVDPAEPVPLDDDRVAVGRRDVGVVKSNRTWRFGVTVGCAVIRRRPRARPSL